MAARDEALSTWTRRIGIAHLATSLSVIAYALSASRTAHYLSVGGVALFLLFGLALALCVLIAHRRAPDTESKKRAGLQFWWFFAAQASFAAQFAACIAYMHVTRRPLP
jgi:hypothetical protein